jgi:RNA polymerase sigma factor (sigma-70 family)
MQEPEVLKILKTGNVTQEVFDWFYTEYFKLTMKVAREICIPIPDAKNILKEAVGDVILKLLSENGEEILNPRAYTVGVVSKKMYNFLRAKSRHRYVDIDEVFNRYADNPDESKNEDGDREKHLKARLNFCVEKLPPSERKPLYLFYYEELSHKEIGQKLNITPGSAKVMVSRGMAKLKKCMSKP